MRRFSTHLLTLCLPLVIFIFIVPQYVHANTEKVIFTVKHSLSASDVQNTFSSAKVSNKSHSILDPTQWKRLSSPHTIIRAETLQPSFQENELVLTLLKQAVDTHKASSVSENSVLVKDMEDGIDLQDREFKWYILNDLEDGASFELRISYPSTSPADFDMKVWTLEEAQEYLPNEIRLADQFSQNTLFARIKATYTGISYQSNGTSSSPETFPIPYNLVLERLYFMIPYQALKLAVVIAAVAVVGLGYIVPTVHRALVNIASAGSRKVKDQ
ncbi:hypothetical protein BGZ46_004419 [Entomortierella lignicola]|nr:hypothetical protein BGZ46_004419 [Entomortierella lignicola]